MTKENIYSLSDGTIFVINPELEAKPVLARNQKLTLLMGMNFETMAKDKRFTAEAVRALATGLINVYEGKNRVAKKDLVECLIKVVESEKDNRDGFYKRLLTEKHFKTSEVDFVIDAFQAGKDDSYLAEMAATIIELHYKTPKSIVKTGIPWFLDVCRLHPESSNFQDEIKNLKKLIYKHYESLQKEVNNENKVNVSKHNRDQKMINESIVMEFAKKTLRNGSADWRLTTLAIAIVTGRRMAEILGNHSTYAVRDANSINFKGLLKGKGRGVWVQDDGYLMPGDLVQDALKKGKALELMPLIEAEIRVVCLDDPKVIVEAWQRLDEEGRKGTSSDQVNTQLAKEFSSRLPMEGKIMYQKSGSLPTDGLSQFKDTRDFYAAYLANNVWQKGSGESEVNFVMRMLHHDQLGTALTYQKFSMV